ncbi:MAG: hypothetical protein HYX32_09595 [Actinobacteria bacterium]|nr:hypothetical protein [Actinomycetota bacterium]
MHSTRSSIARGAVVALAALAVVLFSWAPSALADAGEGESDKSTDLVRQAIAILVNEPDNMESVAEKLDDASSAPDQSGTDVALVVSARDALMANDPHRARTLAEQAIGAKPHLASAETPAIGETTPSSATAGEGTSPMTMATGAQAGEATFPDPLEVRTELAGRDLTVLVLSILVGAVGVYLALRFRPQRREVHP